jgi:hypothetical protein
MGAEPFIPPPAPPDEPLRLGWALAFVAFGFVVAGAILAYMLPLSAEAQWGHPPARARVTGKEIHRGEVSTTTWYAVAWMTPAGEPLAGKISPLLAEPRAGQTVSIRYALRGDGTPTVFLDTPLEVWGPPVGILAVTGVILVPLAFGYGRRLLRARRARGPTPGSDPTP